MRFYRDDPRTCLVRWFFVPAGTPRVPFSTPFRSLNWMPDAEIGVYGEGLGEDYLAERLYADGSELNGAEFPGDHFCGTEDQWHSGQKLPPVPPVPLQAVGIPLCCPEVILALIVENDPVTLAVPNTKLIAFKTPSGLKVTSPSSNLAEVENTPADHTDVGNVSLANQWLGAGEKYVDKLAANTDTIQQNANGPEGASRIVGFFAGDVAIVSPFVAPDSLGTLWLGTTGSGIYGGILTAVRKASGSSQLILGACGDPSLHQGVTLEFDSADSTCTLIADLVSGQAGPVPFVQPKFAVQTTGPAIALGQTGIGGGGDQFVGGICVGLGHGGGGGSGTVTSVDASGGTTGMTFTGGPITTSGVLTLHGTLNVANGGTGATSLTANCLLLGNGTGPVGTVAAMGNGQLLIGQAGGAPAPQTLSGDGTVDAAGVFTLASTAGTPGMYGDATHVAQITVDSKGRVTSATNVAIAGAIPFDIGVSCPSGTPGYILILGSGPSVQQVPYLSVAQGGTGITSAAAGAVLLGTGGLSLGMTSPSALGQVLVDNGTGAAPTFAPVPFVGGIGGSPPSRVVDALNAIWTALNSLGAPPW